MRKSLLRCRHPLDHFAIERTGEIKQKDAMTDREFDDWYNRRYGYGSRLQRGFLFFGILFCVLMAFTVVIWNGIIRKRERDNQQNQQNTREVYRHR